MEPTLEEFMELAVEDVQDVLNAKHILISENMRVPITEAWEELVEGDTNSWLNSRKEDLINTQSKNPSSIKGHGLSGKQWLAKCKGFFQAHHWFKLFGGVKKLKSVLNWIIDILGSISSALGPLGAPFEAFKEFVELIKKVMNDSEYS